jgi:hypothetical protein
VAALARLQALAGDEAGALARLRAALATAPDAAASRLLGELLLGRGEAEAAAEALAASDDTSDEARWLLLVQAHKLAGAEAAALRVAGEGCAALPTSQQLHALQAMLLRETGRAAEGLAVLRRLEAAVSALDPRLLVLSAELQLETSDAAGAIATLRRALAAEPRHKEARLLLIAALAAAGQPDARDAEARAAIAEGTLTGEEVATILLEAGDVEGAELHLAAAVAALDVRAEGGRRAVTLLAMIYVASGRREAVATLRAAQVARAGGATSPAGQALAAAVDEAVAGAEQELQRMAAEGDGAALEEGEAPAAAGQPSPPAAP